MFTGIVEQVGEVAGLARRKGSLSLQVRLSRAAARVKTGSSVAINGVCLTVVRRSSRDVVFDVVAETLRKTNLEKLKSGDPVNVEFSLTPSSEIAGHWVTGHVDGTGEIIQKKEAKGAVTMWVKVAKGMARQIIPKGSVAVDGVSLTVVDVHSDRFSVALIPYTLKHTILGRMQKGDRVNIELDVIGKYVSRYVSARGRSKR